MNDTPGIPAGSRDDESAASSAGRVDEHKASVEFPIVGIGASAGGVQALTALFTALPANTGMSFVVVTHLDPSHPSILPSILARATKMPVTEVTGADPVEPNHVYVLPPASEMTIAGGTLQLRPRSTPHERHPIDLFFRSLAADARHHGIGVVLSGTADDGTLGVRAIKAENGITFAQDDSARQTSMPDNAIADGHVDFVLPPDQIASELERVSRAPREARDPVTPVAEEATRIPEILRLIRRDTGVDFTHYKNSTLRRRILRRALLKKKDGLRDYTTLLRDTPTEVQALHDDLLIGVTSFFRDPDAFDALSQKAFPRLFADRGDDPMRVWVLGCSTGEEAYSLAMALTEFQEEQNFDVRLQIFASDLNAAGIDFARSATYSREITQDVSPERLHRFFTSFDGHYRVIKSIRDVCVFSRHNVLTDPPFSRIDLVSCRNLLMYLEPSLQQEVIRNLHYALKPDGILWLGPADSTGNHGDLFDVVDSQHRIFAPRSGTASHPTQRTMSSRLHRMEAPATGRPLLDAADLLKESDRFLLSRFAPPAVLVSPSMEVLQYRGDVGPYVSPASGKASLNLMQVLDRGLQVAVRAAITKSEKQREAVRTESIRFSTRDGRNRELALEVVPIGSNPLAFLVLFEETPGRDDAPHAIPRPQPATGSEAAELARVSKELVDTQLYLQTMMEEQEAAHQDLESAHEQAQSANEELQSINEELETSKEEIQSANEELTTLNDELGHRNSELQQTNSDLLNLMTSTNLAVLFVGPDMNIRRFTSSASTLLGLRPADIGRPIGELRLSSLLDLETRVVSTIETLTPNEHTVQDDKGRWLSLRVRPYRSVDNVVDGAVIVFVDIDETVRARLYAESILATVRAPLVVLNDRLNVVTANQAFYRRFGLRQHETEGRSFFELRQRQWDVPELRELLEQVLPKNNVVNDFSIELPSEAGERRAWILNATRLVQPEAGRPMMLISMEDVSERERSETLRRERIQELAAADQSKNEFLAMLAHELRNPLAPIQTAAQILGSPGLPSSAVDSARVVINRQIRNMARLIDDLLDVARITQNKLDMRLAPLELKAVVRRAVDAVEQAVKDRQQQISVSMPDSSLYLLGDATRLEQAFGNLLNNASKYTKGGGRISIDVEPQARSGGTDVLIHVRDEGIGIPPEQLPQVFDMFKQAGASPHRTAGLGVGLALVRRVIELHGGQVTASSAGTDRGSEFVVCLPLLEHKVTVADEDGELREEAPGEPQRILVVDDNVDAAQSLASLLRMWGHDVRAVHDGPDALEVAPQFRPSVILLDIAMPGITGFEVARVLRRMPSLDNPMLVALTGFGREQDRQLAREVGFDRYVTKPIPPAALWDLLKRRETDG